MDNNKYTEPQHCGTKPKKIAFGIAPLGIISIGIVPMGVISIGVVPMGVVSLGAVAMGIINLSVVGMGIISSGITTMGVWEYTPKPNSHNHYTSPQKEGKELLHKNEKMLFRSKLEAEKMAENLKCKGAHKMGDYWMPCHMH